mgnify:CR=1 FL=1
MKYPKVKDVQVKVGSLLRAEDDLYIYSKEAYLSKKSHLLGIVLAVDRSPLERDREICYDYVTVIWENGNQTLYLYGDEEVLSI